MKANSLISADYQRFVAELKERIQSASLSAARSVNHDLILLYWDIGYGILEKQELLGWGESVIEQVSMDLQAAFPGSTGYSPRNLRSARQLYLTYRDPAIWLQPVAKLASQPGGRGITTSAAWAASRASSPIFVDGGNLADWIRSPRLYEGGPDRAVGRMNDEATEVSFVRLTIFGEKRSASYEA